MAIAKLTKKIARDTGFTREGKPLIVILEPGGEITVKTHGSPKKQSILADALYDQLVAAAAGTADAPAVSDEGTALIDRVIELLAVTPVGEGGKADGDVKITLNQILKRIKAEKTGHADVVEPDPAAGAAEPAAAEPAPTDATANAE